MYMDGRVLYAIYMKLLFKSTIKFCAFSCLTDSSSRSPIPIAALRHHHQNTFSEQFGHSSSATHGALSSAFGADTHYFRLSSPAADDVAAAACYNRSSSGRVTFLLLAEIKKLSSLSSDWLAAAVFFYALMRLLLNKRERAFFHDKNFFFHSLSYTYVFDKTNNQVQLP
jgi:hypothetical protein